MIKSDVDLRNSIEGLYRTFSRYPLPLHVPARQVVDWLRDPARKTEIEQTFFHLGADEGDSAQLSKAVDDLARIS